MKRRVLGWLITIAIALVVLCAAYVWMVLTWSYSAGERAGYVQKLSEKGWVCKTWEGEIAMVSMPGAAIEKFPFTVRDENVAKQISNSMGKRVSLQYQQHVGIPSSCFGETEYFITGVRVVDDPHFAAPPAIPPAQPAEPANSQK